MYGVAGHLDSRPDMTAHVVVNYLERGVSLGLARKPRNSDRVLALTIRD